MYELLCGEYKPLRSKLIKKLLSAVGVVGATGLTNS